MTSKQPDPKTEAVFVQLLELAKQTAAAAVSDADLYGAIAFQTAGGEIHTFLYEFPSPDAYGRILAALNGSAAYLVTVWKDGTVDLPAYELREKLIAADPRNADAKLLLQGEGYLNIRSIGSTM